MASGDGDAAERAVDAHDPTVDPEKKAQMPPPRLPKRKRQCEMQIGGVQEWKPGKDEGKRKGFATDRKEGNSRPDRPWRDA